MTNLVTDCTVPPYGRWVYPGERSRSTLERTSDPEIEPIDRTSMKRNLATFLSDTSEDADIDGLIQGAREWVEEFTARALVDQAWRQTVEGDFGHEIRLYRSPVLSIASVKTVDTAGVETTLDASTYELRKADSKYPTLFFPNGNRFQRAVLRIAFRAGYADRAVSPQEDATAIPLRFITAMYLWAQANYRGNSVQDFSTAMQAAESVIKTECADTQFA